MNISELEIIRALSAGEVFRWNYPKAVGTSVQVTFAFPIAAPIGVNQQSRNGYFSLSEPNQAIVRSAIADLDQFLDIQFAELATNMATQADIRVAFNQQSNSLGYAYFPAGGEGGDVYLSRTLSGLEIGSLGYFTFLHELGHAVGLKHPGNYSEGDDGPFLPNNLDSADFTVMSYNGFSDGIHRINYGPYDILVLRHLYGIQQKNWLDTRYKIEMYDKQYRQTIIDDGGIDLIDLSVITNPVFIDLGPGAFSSLSSNSLTQNTPKHLSLAFSTLIENAIGTPYDDQITGNVLDNLITPGLGNDVVNGGPGQDGIFVRGLATQLSLSGNTLFSPDGQDTMVSIEHVMLGATWPVSLPLISSEIVAAHQLLNQITNLYVAYFKRPGDVEGLEYWFANVYSGAKTLRLAAEDFAWSPEYLTRYTSSLTNPEFVQAIYQNLFSRIPDPDGMTYWALQLDQNAVQRSGFILDVIQGAYAQTSGPEDRTLIDNKTAVALHYSEGLAIKSVNLFDPGIVHLIDSVTGAPQSVDAALNAIDVHFVSGVPLELVGQAPHEPSGLLFV